MLLLLEIPFSKRVHIKQSSESGISNTFGQSTGQWHGARQEYVQDAYCEQGEAERTGEIDLEGCGVNSA